MSSFAELGVSAPVCAALAERDIHAPFAVQALALPDALDGLDVLVKSPTGSGKTLAFVLPIVERLDRNDRKPAALVLAPTRELAVQIAEEAKAPARARGLTVATVYGGVGLQKQAQLARRAHLLVATPGRLIDLMERGDISLRAIRMLVLDEADRMLDMGFRPAVDQIVRATPRDRQTLFFSATLDGEVGRLADEYTYDAVEHEHAPVVEADAEVDHRFIRVVHEDKVGQLVAELQDPERDLALVFVRTKRGADRLVKRLGTQNVRAVALHGDKSQAQRERALGQLRAGKVDTLIATDVAARGIDVSGITHVIQYDAPGDHTDYVHRTGRTGRAGRGGVAITFVMGDQAKEVGTMARHLDLHHEFERAGFVSHASGPAAPRRRSRRRR